MTELPPPRIPDMSEAQIALRRSHLLAEIDRHAPVRARRVLARIAGAAAAASAAVIIALVAFATSSAFAGWTASPRRPAPPSLHTAESACTRVTDAGAASPVLVDGRGPYVLLLYASRGSSTLCLSGPSFTFVGRGRLASPLRARRIALTGILTGSTAMGPFSYAVGRVGEGVRGLALALDDGTTVRATVANGWFAAWWPGKEGIRSEEITTASGVVTQKVNLRGPPPEARS